MAMMESITWHSVACTVFKILSRAFVPVSGTAEEEGTSDAWYDPLLRIPDDAWRMLLALFEAQKARLAEGNLLDWLTFGIVSGFVNGLSERADVMMEEPSFFNIGNWLTLGLFDLGKGAFAPEEPLSLEHWLNAFGFASVVYGAYTAVRRGIYSKQNKTGNSKIVKDSVANFSEGMNFSKKALKHMNEPWRTVPVQTLQDAVITGNALPDPRGSSATMYYSTMIKNGKMYNLEVLYNEHTNTIYHFEYTKKSIGNLPNIPN